MKFTTRQIQLLNCFRNNEWLTSAQIANYLGCSSRTIRDEIKEINALSNESIIQMEKGKGYRLLKPLNTLSESISSYEYEDNFEDDNIRDTKILKLILANEKTNLYDLSDEFYISESTLLNIIDEFNQIIHKLYPNITIHRKNNFIVPPENESDKRKLLSCFLMREINNFNFDISNYKTFFSICDLTQLQSLVTQFNNEHKLNMRNFEIFSFVLHIAIILERIQKHETMDSNQAITTDTKADYLAQLFQLQLKNKFNINLPNNEIKQISLLFSGKIASITIEIVNELNTLIDSMLISIKEIYSFDLTNNTKIKDNLLVHLLGLESRIRSHSFLINPLTDDIKKHFPLLFDISVYMALQIQNHFSTILPEDEIGYLTLHLMNDVDRYQKKYNRKVILISSLGTAETSYITSKLITLSIKLTVDIVAKYSLLDATKCKDSDVDLIISTFPLTFKPKAKTYICSHLLNDDDLDNIQKILEQDNESFNEITHFFDEKLFFYHLDLNSEEKIIEYICNQMKNLGYCDETLVDKVLQREKVAPTNYGNLFAIPHPIEKVAFENKIAVAILKNTIKWQGKKTKLVLLFGLSNKKDESFEKVFEKLVSLLDDIEYVKTLCKQNNLKDFLNIFNQ